MPLYEYRCQDCGKIYQDLLPLKERDQGNKCPFCGSRAAVRLNSTFSVGDRASASYSSSTTGRSGIGSCSTGMCGLN
ncbi:MAG: zinc ribbon domain-containing protein [Candidatus Atribacteria bacterium]|nr:zinc ribbon domain-containing protein [Candidatus Atribacteria bacterium]